MLGAVVFWFMERPNPQTAIVGKWHMAGTTNEWEFFSDGTAALNSYRAVRYSFIDDNHMRIGSEQAGFQIVKFELNRTGDRLTLQYQSQGALPYEYRKVE